MCTVDNKDAAITTVAVKIVQRTVSIDVTIQLPCHTVYRLERKEFQVLYDIHLKLAKIALSCIGVISLRLDYTKKPRRKKIHKAVSLTCELSTARPPNNFGVNK